MTDIKVVQASPADKSIGDIIRSAKNLDADKVQQIVNYQREHNLKFGEAAVALGIATRDDVLWALSQQFNYPYAAQSAQVPSEELIVASSPFSEEAEFFRDLRTHIINTVWAPSAETTAKKVLAITSADSGDGKTFIAANLAIALSQLGQRTLLIDADMRTPRAHELFGVNTGQGLSAILSGRGAPSVLQPISTLPNLFILPVGVTPPNPLELLQTEVFSLLISDLARKFSYIVVDTPAARHGADHRVIARHCGSALVVARKNVTKMARVTAVTNGIAKVAPGFAGVIMNAF